MFLLMIYSNRSCQRDVQMENANWNAKKKLLLKIQLNNYMKCYAIDKIIVPLLPKSNHNKTLEAKIQTCKPVSDIRPRSPAQYVKSPACGSSLVPDKCSFHLCSGKTE